MITMISCCGLFPDSGMRAIKRIEPWKDNVKVIMIMPNIAVTVLEINDTLDKHCPAEVDCS